MGVWYGFRVGLEDGGVGLWGSGLLQGNGKRLSAGIKLMMENNSGA